MIKRVLTMALTLMLGLCIFVGCAGDGYDQISAKEAKTIMDTKTNYVIVDVRRSDEFASGHIKNAINLPNETIEFYAEEKLPNKDQLILVYCRTGNRSKKACEKLVELGYTNLKEFGGIETDWTYDDYVVKDWQNIFWGGCFKHPFLF